MAPRNQAKEHTASAQGMAIWSTLTSTIRVCWAGFKPVGMRIGRTVSILLRQQDRRRRPIVFGDDVEAVACGCAVATQ